MAKTPILVLAGEKSAEEHFLGIYADWIKTDPNVHFFGVGGDEMERLGVELIYHLKSFSSWGISEVIGKIPFYWKAMKKILYETECRNVKYALLIDFQTFNLKLAEKLKKRGIKVFYYVAPQAWAWKEYRVKRLAASAEILFAFIPFEKKWFMERGVTQVVHVAHPLFLKNQGQWPTENVLAPPQLGEELNLLILPGSRNQEVRYLLPLFLEVAEKLTQSFQVRLICVVSNSVLEKWYQPLKQVECRIFPSEQLPEALKMAHFAFAASGTITLSLALFAVPGVILYKGSLLEQFVFENAVKYRGPIALANIFLNRKVYPELIQDKATTHELKFHAQQILHDPKKWIKMRSELLMTQKLAQGDLKDPGRLMAQNVRQGDIV